MAELTETLHRCRENVARFQPQARKIGEQNTKASLIEPVIAALGWDTIDPDEVHREYRRRGADNPVDYALLLLRTPRLFVEAKGLGENIDDQRWTNQTISYAAVAGVEWVALTDGNEWRVYNAHAPVPAEQKLFRRVRIDDDLDEAVEVLSLLSKDNMAENRIELLWKSHFVDRQVLDVLEQLFDDPPNDLVNLVRKRLSELGAKEVRASLGRVAARFDFPAVQLPAAPAGPTPAPARADAASPKAPPAPPAGQPKHKAKPRRSSAVTGIKLPDLMRAGLTPPGTTLTASYRGEIFTATVTAAGDIDFDGQRFYSPSGAGQAVKRSILGQSATASRVSTDGWSFWSTTDRSGATVTLQDLRLRLAGET